VRHPAPSPASQCRCELRRFLLPIRFIEAIELELLVRAWRLNALAVTTLSIGITS